MEKLAMVLLKPNSIKLVLAKVEFDKYFFVYDEYQESVKIAKDLEVDGVLKTNRISETIKILKTFKKICENQNINKIVAYSTHFITEAKNQRSFLEEVESACGLQFKILSEQEETQSLYTGIMNTVDMPRGIIISIEDTATYILKYNRRNVINKAVIPYGTDTMAELFMNNELTPEENCRQMQEFFADQIKDLDFLKQKEEEFHFVGIGKIFQSLGKLSRKMLRYPLDIENNYIMTNEKFNQVYDFVKTLDIDRTKKLKGISSDRADILASGLCIIKAITDRITTNNIIVSLNEMYDGILFNYIVPATLERPISDILIHNLTAISSCLPTSKKNGQKVMELSVLIFRQLRVLHKLTRPYIRAMKIACFLYGCGELVSYNNMRKSCFNIILNLNINGATHKEILLGAFIASSLYANEFNLAEWVKYKDILTDFDLEAMKKLAAIVRITVGLDISQHGYITDIFCDVLGDSVIMKSTSENDIKFEIKHGLEGAIDFKKAFGKYLEIL